MQRVARSGTAYGNPTLEAPRGRPRGRYARWGYRGPGRDFSISVPLCAACSQADPTTNSLKLEIRGHERILTYIALAALAGFVLALIVHNWAIAGGVIGGWMIVGYVASLPLRPLRQRRDAAERIAGQVKRAIEEAVEARKQEVEGEIRQEQEKRLTDLQNLRKLTGYQFEEVVSQVLRRMGYTAHRTRGSADGGVDIEAVTRDNERVVVQCKNHESAVGPSVIRDLYGVVIHSKAAKGILVSTGTFSDAARDFASHKPVELVSGTEFLEWVKQYGIQDLPSVTNSALSSSPTRAPVPTGEDAAPLVVTCLTCGARNRVNPPSRRKEAVCGRCRSAL